MLKFYISFPLCTFTDIYKHYSMNIYFSMTNKSVFSAAQTPADVILLLTPIIYWWKNNFFDIFCHLSPISQKELEVTLLITKYQDKIHLLLNIWSNPLAPLPPIFLSHM